MLFYILKRKVYFFFYFETQALLCSTHTLNHLVLTKMYQLNNLNKIKWNRTLHIWQKQTYCTSFHHTALTRKYSYCTHIKLRNKFGSFWSMLFTEWTFLPGLTNFTTEDNQALTFKISASTKRHIRTIFCTLLTLELWPTSYPSIVSVNLSNTYKSPNTLPEYKDFKREYTRAVQFLYFQKKATFPTNYKRTATPQAVVCKTQHLDRYKHTT